MAPPRKLAEQYEREAKRVGKCLVHPSFGAARKIYQIRHGKLKSSKILVCHTCDNRFCIKDSHHFLGTKKTNTEDAVSKGRHSCFKNCAKPGKAHPFYGGHQSSSAKRAISKSSLKMWALRSKKDRRALALKTWRTRRANS